MPPCFGGKSFVTRRCGAISLDAAGAGACSASSSAIAGSPANAAEQVVAAEATARPGGVAAEHRVRVGEVALEGGDGRGVPPSPALPSTTSALRRTWSGSRRGMYHSPCRAQDLVVVDGEQVEHRHPGDRAVLGG